MSPKRLLTWRYMSSTPSHTVPHNINNKISDSFMSCHTVSDHITPYHTKRYHIIRHNIVSCDIIRYRTISSDIIRCHIVSYLDDVAKEVVDVAVHVQHTLPLVPDPHALALHHQVRVLPTWAHKTIANIISIELNSQTHKSSCFVQFLLST